MRVSGSPGISIFLAPSARWTICAMLFFATSINYIYRQVLGILAPTLQHSIGRTQAQYGYIVAAFQIAYALGLVAAGRMVDRLGCRIGHALLMGAWSLASMGHALAHALCRPRILFVDRRGIVGSCGRGAPWMVSKFVYCRFRYVPKDSRWDSRGHWGNGRGARRSVVLIEHGMGFAVNAQLYSAFCVDRLGIFGGLVASATSRARFAPALNRFDRESAEKLSA
jgi:MFS family permease